MQLQRPQESDRLCKVLALLLFIMMVMMVMTIARDGDEDEDGDNVLFSSHSNHSSYQSPLQGA